MTLPLVLIGIIVALYFRTQNNQIILSGETYPLRDQIKVLGGRFIGQTKSWLLPDTASVRAQIAEWGARDLAGAAVSLPGDTPGAIDQPTLAMPALTAGDPPPSSAADVTKRTESISVRQLVERVGTLIQQAFFAPVWIIGEIQNLTARPRGIFLSLAEPKDMAVSTSSMSVNATIWSNAIQSFLEAHGRDTMAALLVDGMKVRVFCSVGFYRDRGSLSLNIIAIDPSYTKGALALAREELLRELRKSGLAYQNKATILTDFPLKIGLISAEGSRAKSDFLDQLALYGYPGTVVFHPAQMQGEALPREVVEGIRALSTFRCDLIVLTRGGGSAGDLRWFDSPEVAYAIAACPLPVIAAIGHHDDQSVAEEISFHREKTPTAAADFIIYHLRKTETRLDDAIKTFSRVMDERIEDAQNRYQYLIVQMQLVVSQKLMVAAEKLHLVRNTIAGMCHTHVLHLTRSLFAAATTLLITSGDALALQARQLQITAGILATKLQSGQQATAIRLQQAGSLLARTIYEKIGEWQSTLSQKSASLFHSSQNRLLTTGHHLEIIDNLLGAHDPRALLRKGFTQLKGPHGVIKSITAIDRGERLKARLSDGSLTLVVDDVMSADNDSTKQRDI